MHNAAFSALGVNWRYFAFEVEPVNLRAAIQGAKAMQFAGLNLTVPHKLLALNMVDVLDESAKRWGAVNTIHFEGRTAKGDWHPLREFGVPPSGGKRKPVLAHDAGAPREIRAVGFNTDADAIVTALREDLKIKLPGAKILLLGAGGAGRTAALKLASENVGELFLVNRTRSKAEAVAAEIAKQFPSVRVFTEYPKTAVDLVLNATSLGLKPDDALPLDERCFSMSQTNAVYDMIYRPAETKLLAAARRAGRKTANGLGMLLYQGAKAFEIWTGQPAPIPVMRRALQAAVQSPGSPAVSRGRKIK